MSDRPFGGQASRPKTYHDKDKTYASAGGRSSASALQNEGYSDVAGPPSGRLVRPVNAREEDPRSSTRVKPHNVDQYNVPEGRINLEGSIYATAPQNARIRTSAQPTGPVQQATLATVETQVRPFGVYTVRPKASKTTNQAYQHKNRKFTIEHSSYFRAGRLFLCGWSEPRGLSSRTSPDPKNANAIFDRDSFLKRRPMVVLSSFHGHCVCAPIYTYNNQGIDKSGGLHRSEIANTAVVHEFGRSPKLSPAEMPHMSALRAPIAVILSSKDSWVQDGSRIRFDQAMTVQYNFPVADIGMVVPEQIDLVRMWHMQAMLEGRSEPMEGTLPTQSAPTVTVEQRESADHRQEATSAAPLDELEEQSEDGSSDNEEPRGPATLSPGTGRGPYSSSAGYSDATRYKDPPQSYRSPPPLHRTNSRGGSQSDTSRQRRLSIDQQSQPETSSSRSARPPSRLTYKS